MNYKLPFELPDQNKDGFAENQDFQRAFKYLNLTRYEISAVFDHCDYHHRGKINQAEWNNFYLAFIQPFEEADKEPRDGVLDETEALESIQDLNFAPVLQLDKHESYFVKIMEILNSRSMDTRGDNALALNLYEYIFLRKAALAWNQCSAQQGLITKSQIQTCAAHLVLNKNIRFSDNNQQLFFKVLQNYSFTGEVKSGSYHFLAFLSVFHKYEMFQRLKQNDLASGSLNWRELQQAVTDSQGPSQKLNEAVINTVFHKQMSNIEFTGLDFKQFFVLMTAIDIVYIYGKEDPGYINLEEWQTMVKDGVIRNDILDNIDDCYIDKLEQEETVSGKSHQQRQQYLLEKMSRFKQKKHRQFIKRVEDSDDARKYIFQIHDTDLNEKLNGGEVFLFFKFAYFFQDLSQGNTHLIYQRNIDFDYQAQMGQFEFGLFKQELFEFEQLQEWIRASNNQDLGLNQLQFSSWFQRVYMFSRAGQQAETSPDIPFPAFQRVLKYMGFQVHKSDIESFMVKKLENNTIQAQKFDLNAYMRDGNYIKYDLAYRKNLERYSKSLMMEKFFSEKAAEGQKRRKARRKL